MSTLTKVLLYLAIGTVFGLFSFGRRYFDRLASDVHASPWPIVVDELSAAWLAALLIFVTVQLALRFPLRRYWWAFLAAAPVYAMTHTLGIFLSRSALYPLLGMGEYRYGDLGYRFLMEAPVQLLGYALTLFAVVFYRRLLKARQAERLEGLLAEAQLDRLRLSVGPHFLFNALNVISAAVYESPEKADELIGRLSRLLRAMLTGDVQQTWPLDEELNLLAEYLALQKARFENDLAVRIDCPDDLRQCQVPRMILQPLVENALKHGADAEGRIDLTVQAKRDGERLVLEVCDHGPGPGESGEGTGTGNTRERIAHLFGPDFGYDLSAGPAGGAVARLRLPWQCAS